MHPLTTSRLEVLIAGWMKSLADGLLPTVDLSIYTHLDLRALTILLAFAQSCRTGALSSGQPTPPLPIVLPGQLRARDFLFAAGFFSLAEPEQLFANTTEYARQEADFNLHRPSRRLQTLPHVPFRRIAVGRHGILGSTAFDAECRNFINELVEVFPAALVKRLGFAIAEAEQFWKPNREIYQNIYMHSGTWGYAALQCYDSGVILCYADLGIGIKESLDGLGATVADSESLPWNDDTAIEIAFRDGLTRIPGESQGYGLAVTKSYVLELSGQLECRSGTAKRTYDAHGFRSYNVHYIPGVQIGIYLPRPERSAGS